jgi:DNA-directed RNA polymerase specialized sigma24 family protein
MPRPGRLTPWLYGIARLVWKDHRRHRGRDLYGATSLAEVEDLPAQDPDALGTAEQHEEEGLIRVAIPRLPVEQHAQVTMPEAASPWVV